MNISLRKNTELNKRDYPIIFQLNLLPIFSKRIPVIICITNFCFPSIVDNRNLFKCLCKNWEIQKNEDLIQKIITIILNIPNFVNTYDQYVTNYKLLFLPGEFSITNQSYINDFLLNNENIIFKIQTNFLPNEAFCYLILTDINYLLLVPCKLSNMKNWGTVFYSGLISEIDYLKKISDFKDNISFKIIIKNYVKCKPFDYDIICKSSDYKYLHECLTEKVKKLSQQISLIIPNFIKIKQYIIDKNTMGSLKNLVNTIKKNYKEKKANNIFEANVLTELFNFMYELLNENGEKEAANYYKIKLSKFDN